MVNARKSDNIDKHVGERVRMRRIMLAMSQTELGVRIGLTFQQVQKYEKGSNRIGASRLYSIARVLDVPISFFFEDLPASKGRPGNGMPDHLLDLMGTASGQRLIQALAKVSDTKMRAKFVDLIEAMSSERREPKRQKA